MKWFIDGDQVVVTKDDFVDLQESPAVFIRKDSPQGSAIQASGVRGLPFSDRLFVEHILDHGGGTFIP